MEPHFYTVEVKQNVGGKGGAEGRVGTLSEPNNSHFPQITIQSPAEFKGPAGEDGKSLYWTPEDLFVSSAAVCLFTTFVAIAEHSHLKYADFKVVAKGTLDKVPDAGSQITEIVEDAEIVIFDEKDRKKAEKVIEKSEKGCLIVNSMKTKVTLNINIIVKE